MELAATLARLFARREKTVRIVHIAALLTVTFAPLSRALASDAGYSTVVAKVAGSLAAVYTDAHTDREWVRAWKLEGPYAQRDVTLRQAGDLARTTYLRCVMVSAENQTATLTINCQGSLVTR